MKVEVMICPKCRSSVELSPGNDHAVCAGCAERYPLEGHWCGACSTYHQARSSICQECGALLVLTCRHCYEPNWPGAEICRHCGHSLNMVDQLSDYHKRDTADRLNQQMRNSTIIKEQERQSSQERMTELIAIEEARQAELQQRAAKQKEQERQMLILVFGAVLLFIIFLVVYALVNAPGL